MLTLGKSGAADNVVALPERLAELGVQYFHQPGGECLLRSTAGGVFHF